MPQTYDLLELTDAFLRRLMHDIFHVRWPEVKDTEGTAEPLLELALNSGTGKEMADVIWPYINKHKEAKESMGKVPVPVIAMRYADDIRAKAKRNIT